ncbi:FAD binding domain-containing protein [Xylaria bambusicola]|uniref:FAD binding domain-containing protein n=1 Tax=Xylaria bambusicola TaxID=326684 RepID=UPI00200889A6|nr:FAD binding domain-containing protein [Xylaria bambusicola]KAI0521889.1 FAD binding domain-containing protein [Xylaria bambusicola]
MIFSTMRRDLAVAVIGLAAVVAAQSTCDLVQSQTSIESYKNPQIKYTAEQSEYWSTSCGDLKPSCILMPTTAHEVAAIVSILAKNNETFAVKSGGHNPNNYFASVDGGPLISTKMLNQVILDPTAETVRVGPGNRWDEVTKALDGSGYTVVGGRIGNVGVGGYLLGGGLSFMSTEYGWAANSILEYELVLANASVVYVTENNYPDLFMALKGGGNNYGIVTSYLLQAYPIGDIWGGNLVFDAKSETSTKILAAVRDFTEHYDDDKAGIIVTAERTLATLVDIWVIFLYYNGPEPPKGVFDKFFAISDFKINTCKTQSIHSLLSGNNWAIVKGSVYTIGTETMPLPSEENGAEVMGKIFDHWVNVSNTAQLVPGLIASVAFQPLPKKLGAIARAKGGDMLDVDDDIDRIVLELDYSFWGNAAYPKIDETMRATYDGFKTIVEDCQDSGLLAKDVYLPLFQNDCFYPQDYFGRLKPEKLALARRVQAEVDPNGFWKTRTGGFKIPSA